MNIKERFKTKEYLKKGFMIGLFVGAIKIFLSITFENSNISSLRGMFGREFVVFCKMAQIEAGESCGYPFGVWFFIISPLFFALLGALTLYCYRKIKVINQEK